MPIAALSENTVHAIASTQVLTDSHSLVKELIDNALDARASAIFIEISPNTLDVIQVKDNGYGIAPVDRPLVCKRHCTSKIKCFDDIVNIGGHSLGFRGEALASAADMSGLVVITTKVEGEPTAVSHKIGRKGDIESEERTSHAVGTTVRIVDFLKSIPVRRQTALKQTTKTLSNIRKTIQAYALARPATRYSLKVLKAKNDKGCFTYAPKSEASVVDAATKLFGTKVVDQCQWRVWTTHERVPLHEEQCVNHTTNPEDPFMIEALLPAPSCDVRAISGIGQYVSVDSRPVSSNRGTLKQIVGIYKSYLRSSSDSGEKIVDPFLYLNVVCPPGSYDANIEPAKNDILFCDALLVSKHLESFFRVTYGELQTTTSRDRVSKPSAPKEQEFGVLLARTHEARDISLSEAPSHPEGGDAKSDKNSNILLPRVPSLSADVVNRAEPIPSRDEQATSIAGVPVSQTPREKNQAGSPSRSSNWDHDMFVGSDNEEMDLFVAPDHHCKGRRMPDLEEQAELQDVRVSNPWTIAKTNAPIRPQAKQLSNKQLLTPARQSYDRDSTSELSPASMIGYSDPKTHSLQTQRPSEDDFAERDLSSSSPERFPYPLAARASRSGDYASKTLKASNRERYGSGALDTWVQKSLGSCGCNSTSSLDDNADIDRETSASCNHDIVSARTILGGTTTYPIQEAPSRHRRSSPKKQTSSGINKPFKSPLNDPGRNWFDTGSKRSRQSWKPEGAIGTQATRNINAGLDLPNDEIESVAGLNPEQPSMHPDLAISLDYESRKALAMQQRKVHLMRQAALEKERSLGLGENLGENLVEGSTIVNTPHKNRYKKALAALHPPDKAPDTAESPGQPSAFEPGDARQYLLRVQEREQEAGGRATVSPSHVSTSKRRKTAMLPLETIRDEWNMRDLVLQVHDMKTDDIAPRVAQAKNSDEYISSGIIAAGLVAGKTIETVRAWESEIRSLVCRNYRSGTTGRGQEAPAAAPAQFPVELWPTMQDYLAGQGLNSGEKRQADFA